MSAICVEWEMIDVKDYRGIWVYMENEKGKINEASLQMLTVAKMLAEKKNTHIAGVLIGYKVRKLAKEPIYYGADKVYVVDDERLKEYYAIVYADVLTKLVKKYKPEAILVGATMKGREFAPFVANSLKTGITADCTSFEVDQKTGDIIQIRPPFGAWMLAHIKTANRRPVMSSVRPNVFKVPSRDENRNGEIIEEEVNNLPDPKMKLIERIPIERSEEMPIEKADILVSGGKGLGSKEGFKILEELASLLGGTVSGSRKAVDAGWLPPSKQVGQTGKTVKPTLYFAIGISGSAQHLFGIREAKRVICINIDPDAAIFENSDYGVVGDYKEIVPALIEYINRIKKR
jgi:electron transfer flavoprotein alpha subunit